MKYPPGRVGSNPSPAFPQCLAQMTLPPNAIDDAPQIVFGCAAQQSDLHIDNDEGIHDASSAFSFELSCSGDLCSTQRGRGPFANESSWISVSIAVRKIQLAIECDPAPPNF
jgi:hypothetical protein